MKHLDSWNPRVAALLNVVIPGAGHVYRGDVAQGLMWLLAVTVSYATLRGHGSFLHILCVTSVGSPAARRASPIPNVEVGDVDYASPPGSGNASRDDSLGQTGAPGGTRHSGDAVNRP